MHLYTNIIQKGDIEVLFKMFDLKKDIIYKETIKAIQRYTGVAFDYLDYDNLDINSKKYINNNIIIFSNLFGAIRADDLILDYRFKQGKNIGDIKVDKFYKECASNLLNDYLEGYQPKL